MSKKIILTRDDAKVYIDISGNYNTARFNIFALRVQEQQLRELLGDPLYNLLYTDLDANGVPQNEPYIKLVNGKTYDYNGDTIEYYGLKPFLAFHWAAINSREGDSFASNYGNVNYDANPQDNMTRQSTANLNALNASYMKSVTSYRNNIVQYLNDNEADFPNWIGKKENKSKTGFNSFHI